MTGEQRLTKMFKHGLQGHYLFKVWGSAFQRGGMPDFYVVVNGVQGWVELKAGSRRVEPLQRIQIQKLKKHGVPCSVIRLTEDNTLQIEDEGGVILQDKDVIDDPVMSWCDYVRLSWDYNRQ